MKHQQIGFERHVTLSSSLQGVWGANGRQNFVS